MSNDLDVSNLEPHYLSLLDLGLTILRQALDTKDIAWAQAELEFLHNIPSLVGETNLRRHRYFWEGELPSHIQWLDEHGSEFARSRYKTFQEPTVREMAPIIKRLLESID